MRTQCQLLAKLLTSKEGCTSVDIVRECWSVSPSRRLSDMRERGWIITKVKVPNKNYFRYFGKQV